MEELIQKIYEIEKQVAKPTEGFYDSMQKYKSALKSLIQFIKFKTIEKHPNQAQSSFLLDKFILTNELLVKELLDNDVSKEVIKELFNEGFQKAYTKHLLN